MTVVSVFGSHKTIPIAEVQIKSRFGEINWPVGVIEYLPVQMIIGNDLANSLGMQFSNQCYVLTTRSKTKMLESIEEAEEDKADVFFHDDPINNDAEVDQVTPEPNSFNLNVEYEAPIVQDTPLTDPDFQFLSNTTCQQFAAAQLSDETLAPLIKAAIKEPKTPNSHKSVAYISKDTRNIFLDIRYKPEYLN